MIKSMRNIGTLIGKDGKRLIAPIVLSVIDSLLNSCMYGVMLFLMLDLAKGSFTSERLMWYTIFLIVIFLLRCVMQAVSFTEAQCVGPDVTHRLRLQVGNHLRNLNLGFFNRNSIGKLTGVLLTDINEFEAIVTHCLCDFIKVISFTLLSLLMAFIIHPAFGLVLTVLVVIALPLLLLSGKISAKNSMKLRSAKENVTSRIVEYVGGMKTFRLYHLTGSRFKGLDESMAELKKASVKTELEILPSAMSFSMVTACIIPSAMILGTFLFVRGGLSVAEFLIMLLLAVSVANILEVLSSLYPQARSISKASESILGILKEKPLPYQKEKVSFLDYDIEFSDVSFSYTKEKPVLQHISFQAKQGTTTALIGPSGSGKTTIVSLLARFWDANHGKITIGGEEIQKISPDELTKYIAIVFQDVYLLNDTVYQNIIIGKPDATKEEVIAAAKAANCHDFIMEMEKGYDTMIGEGGMTLSGGERQRISIARALLKDAPIVLLDETTSSLDADNEFEIQSAFSRLMKDKTVLVIAHRLETIANADRIIVIRNGRIEEQGTPEELLTQGGWYADVYREQCMAQNWKVTNEEVKNAGE